MNKVTGVVRVIDPTRGGRCLISPGLLGENPLSWNVQGPVGATGAPRPAGPQGPAGARSRSATTSR
ncbi:MAG: hypothetical protein QM733_15310 [Ilumatobacteraceae bacterium]